MKKDNYLKNLRYWQNRTSYHITSGAGTGGVYISSGDVIVWIATLAAIAFDFVITFSRYDQVCAPTDRLMLIIMTAAAVFVLDIPPALAGKEVSRYRATGKSIGKMLVIVFCCALLVVGLTILNLRLTIQISDLTFEDPSIVATGIFDEVPAASGVTATAAIVTGLLPFGTSVACFILSLLLGSDPVQTANALKDREIKNLEMDIKRLEADYVHACAVIPGAIGTMEKIKAGQGEAEILGELLCSHTSSHALIREMDALKCRINYIWEGENTIIQGFLNAVADVTGDSENSQAIMEHSMGLIDELSGGRMGISFELINTILGKDPMELFGEIEYPCYSGAVKNGEVIAL